MSGGNVGGDILGWDGAKKENMERNKTLPPGLKLRKVSGTQRGSRHVIIKVFGRGKFSEASSVMSGRGTWLKEISATGADINKFGLK
jgi:hypothetical protein